eukprot:c16904_g1_i1 orf=76-279(-)
MERMNMLPHITFLFSTFVGAALREMPSWANITRNFPSGTQLIRVDNVTDFSVDKEVLVCWPQIAAWI